MVKFNVRFDVVVQYDCTHALDPAPQLRCADSNAERKAVGISVALVGAGSYGVHGRVADSVCGRAPTFSERTSKPVHVTLAVNSCCCGCCGCC